MILNFVVILLVLLIGYWWANQGLFSAVIHLLCVIVAGALALAFWEPIGLGLFMKGSWFDSYAMGVALLGSFAVILFILRLATNKLVPANLYIPKWANLAFGYPVGLFAGVLTMGICIIGLGMIQSQRAMLGFVGQGRSGGGQIARLNSMWVPVHQLTAEFYGQLSVGAMSSSGALRHHNPDVHLQAASLVRDTYRGGRGQVALRPSQATADHAWVCPDKCVVKVRFGRGARDYGSQLTLSGAQVRLISHATGMDRPAVAYPTRWRQETPDGGGKVFAFDDPSHYVTTVPGREQSEVLFEFPWREGLVPRFIQIKNTRFELPRNQVESLDNCSAIMRGAGSGPRITVESFARAPRLPIARNPQGAISQSATTSPVIANKNDLPGRIKHIKNELSEGSAIFPRKRESVSSALRIDMFYAPAGTRVVQVDVSRGTPGSIFGPAAEQAAAGSVPMLVDSTGNTYSAVGYLHEKPQGNEIRLEPSTGLASDQIPHLPTSGDQKLRLIFYVTENAQVIGLQYGDVSLARCTLNVTPKR